MWESWATDVWFVIIGMAVIWEIAALLSGEIPTLSELVTRALQKIGPYGRVAFVIIWIYLAWHFLTGRLFSK